ncbi:hypothetical protein EB077_13920 [bacterium]|nr:hypothetical protein [bacterium]
MTEARIIEDLGAEIIKEQPKKAPYKKTYPKREGAEPADKTNFWQELVDNPNKWFINNEKPTAKYPDFKRKGTGEALWLSDAPAELVGRAKALLG